MGTGATRQRLWNLSPLGGARRDVMNGNQAGIMGSIAARECPRGCYEWTLVQPVMALGGAQGDVINGHWCNHADIVALGGARGDVMNGHWCDQVESIAAWGRSRGCYDVMNG